MWTERVTVTLPGQDAEILREIAAATSRSASAVAAEAVKWWLSQRAAAAFDELYGPTLGLTG